MKPFPTVLIAFIAPLLLSGCGGQPGTTTTTPPPPRTTITASGLQYEDISYGTGSAAKTGDLVDVKLLTYLQAGNVRVDGGADPAGTPQEFDLGKNEIAGLNEGIAGMRTGGQRRLTIPPEIAYGDTGKPPLIPSGAILVCYVTIVQIRPLTTTQDGLQYVNLTVGTGAGATINDVVDIRYSAALSDNPSVVVDSNTDAPAPLEFMPGFFAAIPGLEEGVLGMKVGGRRRLTVPPNLAYRDTGLPPNIPAKATLIYTVDLLQIKPPASPPVTTASGLRYVDITAGTGATATGNDLAAINFSAYLVNNPTVAVDSNTSGTPLEFVPGMGEVIAGLDEGVLGMKVGGKRRMVLTSNLAYGDTGHGQSIAPGSTLVYAVELVDVKPPPTPVVTTASGLKYRDLTVGGGATATGNDLAAINFSAFITTSPIVTVDSNTTGVPLQIVPGVPPVSISAFFPTIPGLEEGALGMAVGGTRRMVIPANLAYGSAGNGVNIPGGSNLFYSVDLADLKAQPANAPVTTPSGLQYVDLALGIGTGAQNGDAVQVRYTGWLTNGYKFDSNVGGSLLPVTLGNHEVIAGFDEGLVGMSIGGKRRLIIPPDLGYGSSGPPPSIPPNATLVFEIEMVQIN